MNTSTTTPSLTDSTIPLLQRTALWPNESLASALERLRQLNFYTHRNLLSTVGRERLAALNIEDKLDQPARLETFQQLANLTHLTLDELYAASNQRFAEVVTPLEQDSQKMPWLDNVLRPRLEPRWAHQHLRSSAAAQFCPRCLQATAYHRLNWVPRAVAICLDHLCLLADHCPRCGKHITVVEVVNQHCFKCQADLRHTPQVSILRDKRGIQSQQVIQSWFKVANSPDEVIAVCHFPSSLSCVLYPLLCLIAQQLLKGQAEWPNLPRPLNDLATSIKVIIKPHQRLTSTQAYHLYQAAFTGLRNWPNGLRQLLNAYRDCDNTNARSPSRQSYLCRMQYDWLRSDWQTSPLAFAQQDFLDYVLKRGLPLMPSVMDHLQDVPWFIERAGLWTQGQTSRLLDLSPTDLHRFYSYGSLTNCLIPHTRTREPRFKQAEVLAVKQRWNTGWSLKDVISWLRVQPTDVLRLVEIGLLPIDGVWAGDDEQGLFNPQIVKDLFAQIVARLKPWPDSWCDLISMSRAVAEVDWLGVDLAVLVQSVLAERVLGHQRSPQIESLYHIYFSQAAIFKLPDQIYAARGWIAGVKFAYEYGFPAALVHDWEAAGSIKSQLSFGSHCYFDQQQLKELAAKHGFLSPVVQPSRKRRT